MLAAAWVHTWLSCSFGRCFGSLGLRLCSTDTLKMNTTTRNQFSFHHRCSGDAVTAPGKMDTGSRVLRNSSSHPFQGPELDSDLNWAAVRPVLTPACRGLGLLVLMGMELWPFREACVLLPLVITDGLLREEVGEVAV